MPSAFCPIAGGVSHHTAAVSSSFHCCCASMLALHQLIQKHRPAIAQVDVDQEDNEGNVVPGAWRAGIQMAENIVKVKLTTWTKMSSDCASWV